MTTDSHRIILRMSMLMRSGNRVICILSSSGKIILSVCEHSAINAAATLEVDQVKLIFFSRDSILGG
ncbi:hypothetical protein M758_8G192000 [Ceratodon purpureus]|uniref:Uncharacterized protein n=1 Tax=Ceratodon purpureus TaxID=3225 RepID=A0A8T0H2V9_CERPU|nr:hypothetical protein KC19_8G197000 [Ceratodon purpureus]KAG0609535.1 hypothetical protein M758_8G192000 [Ceratodon purpureus]